MNRGRASPFGEFQLKGATPRLDHLSSGIACARNVQPSVMVDFGIGYRHLSALPTPWLIMTLIVVSSGFRSASKLQVLLSLPGLLCQHLKADRPWHRVHQDLHSKISLTKFSPRLIDPSRPGLKLAHSARLAGPLMNCPGARSVFDWRVGELETFGRAPGGVARPAPNNPSIEG